MRQREAHLPESQRCAGRPRAATIAIGRSISRVCDRGGRLVEPNVRTERLFAGGAVVQRCLGEAREAAASTGERQRVLRKKR